MISPHEFNDVVARHEHARSWWVVVHPNLALGALQRLPYDKLKADGRPDTTAAGVCPDQDVLGLDVYDALLDLGHPAAASLDDQAELHLAQPRGFTEPA